VIFSGSRLHFPRVKSLEPPDSHHLNAAVGWQGLAAPVMRAWKLAKISPANQQHRRA